MTTMTLRLHLRLSQEYRNRRDLKAAVDEYRNALRIKPDYAEAHTTPAAALCEAGDQDGGTLECREAFRLRPDDFCDLSGAIGGTVGPFASSPIFWALGIFSPIRSTPQVI
jgi:hypothetical protein